MSKLWDGITVKFPQQSFDTGHYVPAVATELLAAYDRGARLAKAGPLGKRSAIERTKQQGSGILPKPHALVHLASSLFGWPQVRGLALGNALVSPAACLSCEIWAHRDSPPEARPGSDEKRSGSFWEPPDVLKTFLKPRQFASRPLMAFTGGKQDVKRYMAQQQSRATSVRSLVH